MRDRSVKTRQGCFTLLSQLVSVFPGCLGVHIPAILPGILFSLRLVLLVLEKLQSQVKYLLLKTKFYEFSDRGSTSNMKIETLEFVQNLLVSQHPPAVFHPHVPG
jgi:hypothetical protein